MVSVIIWLQTAKWVFKSCVVYLGPGCSSIAFGEAEEIGPFHINADGKSVYLNPYSWNEGKISPFLLRYPPTLDIDGLQMSWQSIQI